MAIECATRWRNKWQNSFLKVSLLSNFLIFHSISSTQFTSSHGSCSINKAVHKIFAIFIRKHLCWNLFLIKLQIFRLQHSCFPVNMTKFLRRHISKKVCEQLLLLIIVEGNKIFLKKACFTFIARTFASDTRRRRDISAPVPPRDLWFSCFLPEIPFLSKLGPKIKIVNLSLHLVHRLYRTQWWCLLFLIYTRNTLFGQVWFQKSKLSFKLKPAT